MKREKRVRNCILLFVLIFLFVPSAALADSGPKPSVRITFGSDNVGAYATLLSEKKSTGPHSAWDGTQEHAYHDRQQGYGTPYEIWEAFVSYEDTDGFYFLQSTERKIDKAGEYIWGYYPPERFKLLLYFPESDTFLVSGIYERYAFHSYFGAFAVAGEGMSMFRSYDYTSEAIGFFARVAITLIAELLLALLFFRGERRMLLPIALINVLTQVLLNLSLARTGYLNGAQVLVQRYISLEALVMLIEGAILFFLAPRRCDLARPRLRAVLYAVAANLCSLVLGLIVSDLIPSVF